jgi:photosystem II stability/assembly factor-like uncharacterized protein
LVYFIDQNTGWVVGNMGIILNTTNGGENWTFQTRGTVEDLSSVHFTDNNTGWAVGGSFWAGREIILKTTRQQMGEHIGHLKQAGRLRV